MQEVCSCGAAEKIAMLEEKVQNLERQLEEAQHNNRKELYFSYLLHCLCNVRSNEQSCMCCCTWWFGGIGDC